MTFVHLLTGKAPYDTTTSNDFQIREGIVYKPLDMKGVPTQWKVFLNPYLAKDPKQRPALRSFETSANEVPAIINIEDVAEGAVEDTLMAETGKPAQPLAQTAPTKAPKPAKIETSTGDGKSKKGLWIGLLAVAVIALAVVFLLKLKQQPDPDTEAFQACQTTNDYRHYIFGYGHNVKHYTEAQQFIDNFVADSTAKALAQQKAEAEAQVKLMAKQQEDSAYVNCNTIVACDQYLTDYPNGQYVNQVKAKKIELEQQQANERAEAEAKAKLEAQQKKRKHSAKPNG